MKSCRPRVVVDARALAEPLGGLRRYAECLLPQVARAAPDIDWQLVALNESQTPGGNFPVVVVPGSLNAALRGWWEDHRLPPVLLRLGADALLSLYGIVPHTPIPVIAVVHDVVAVDAPHTLPLLHRQYWRRVASRLPKAHRIVCDSTATANRVRELPGVSPSRVTAALLAPSEAFTVPSIASIRKARQQFGLTRPYVLAVGVANPRKSLHTLIEATLHMDVDLVVVGTGRFPGGVRAVGAVDDPTLAALMAGSSAVACPSIYEGFGLPVVEAMACGAVVLASDTPALIEAAGGAAWILPVGEAAAWADAIGTLVNDPVRGDALRQSGLERVSELSWLSTAQKTVAAIRHALEDR